MVGSLAMHENSSFHQITGCWFQAKTSKILASKTICDEKSLTFRQVAINQCCYVRKPDWLSESWITFCGEASYARDYLMPQKSGNYCGFERAELRYDAGCTLQSRIFGLLPVGEERLCNCQVAQYWTPHLAETSCPGQQKHWTLTRETGTYRDAGLIAIAGVGSLSQAV